MIEAAEIRERWQRAAPGWRAHGEVVRQMTEPVSRAMLDLAAPGPRERWVDVAGGVGDPALYLAQALGVAGLLVITDLVAEMAGVARASVREAAPDRRVFAVAAAAEDMPFAGGFDGLTCRFGAMFFADPGRALADLRQALVPGGCGVFAVWAEPERNPFFREVNAAVRTMFPDAPMPGPDDPHAFRYESQGRLAGLLRTSGWRGVEERRLPFVMTSVLPLERFWDHLVGLSVELAALVKELPAEQARTLREDVEARMRPHFASGSMRIPAEARLVLARTPRPPQGLTARRRPQSPCCA